MRANMLSIYMGRVQAGEVVPDLWQIVNDRVEAPTYLCKGPVPGSASTRRPSVSPPDFLGAVVQRALGVTVLKSPPAGGAPDLRPAMRLEYGKLLQELPESTAAKLTQDVLATEDGRSQAPTQLVGLRKGELVELGPRLSMWRLVKKAPGSASDFETYGPQWYCCEQGRPAGVPDVQPGNDEYGQAPL